ncbi:MAG: hypothetical protein AB7F59_11970 [Bdellovibrionales bacterium]
MISLIRIFCPLLFITMISYTSQGQGLTLYKGISTVSKNLSIRIGSTPDSIHLNRYLGDDIGQLLGYWEAGTYRNGLPNATNLMVWHLGFDSFITHLLTTCAGHTLEFLDPQYREFLFSFCKWPSPEVRNAEVLEKFWIQHMAYDAPYSEFLSWKALFLSETYQTTYAPDALRDMWFAIFINPHFLLKK